MAMATPLQTKLMGEASRCNGQKPTVLYQDLETAILPMTTLQSSAAGATVVRRTLLDDEHRGECRV